MQTVPTNSFDYPVVILAGGKGSRLSEETMDKIPKPMVEIGGIPILFHIMKMWHTAGFHNFIVAGGYKIERIWEYVQTHEMKEIIPDSIIDIVNTGLNVETGGRLLKLYPYLMDYSKFYLSYGDGVTSLDLSKLVHNDVSFYVTAAVTHPVGRFGEVEFEPDQNSVTEFSEKPITDKWVSAGFFEIHHEVFDYFDGDGSILERDVFPELVKDIRMRALPFTDFWHPMDTPKDKRELEEIWNSGNAPWRVWK